MGVLHNVAAMRNGPRGMIGPDDTGSLAIKAMQRPRRQRLWDAALDFLVPPRCVGCGRRGADVCQSCCDAIQPLGPAICPRCARPSLEGRICGRCGSQLRELRAVLAAYPFDGVIRAAILAFKYRRCTRLADFLAPALLDALRSRPLTVDVIVPVPLSQARQSERGFNQSELLAGHLAGRIGLPLETAALVRHRDTPQQTRLPARERSRNVAGAFGVSDPAAVAGRRILLVDDVCTTVATLEACARALDEAGAQGVWAVVVAREA